MCMYWGQWYTMYMYLNQMSRYLDPRKAGFIVHTYLAYQVLNKDICHSCVSIYYNISNLFCQEEFEGSDVESAWSDTEFSWSNRHSQNSAHPPTIQQTLTELSASTDHPQTSSELSWLAGWYWRDLRGVNWQCVFLELGWVLFSPPSAVTDSTQYCICTIQ